jgi:hypothetical protein
LSGPILAVFLLGILSAARPPHVKAGVVAGIVVNLLLWRLTDVSWLWWNVTGFAGAVVVALGMLAVETVRSGRGVRLIHPDVSRHVHGGRGLLVSVLGYSLVIVLVVHLLQFLSGAN